MNHLVYNEILRHLPDRLGNGPRAVWLRRHSKYFGRAAIVARGCRILGSGGLSVGDEAIVARDVTLDARGGLSLGVATLVGLETLILTHTHRSLEVGVPIQAQGMYDGPVSIGDRAWLGARVIVLPGVTIGADAIVAAGAVVAADVPERTVVGGVPARLVKHR